ncbi:MAG: sulfate adenylyltransferase, partial [Chloroflexi bacterium]
MEVYGITPHGSVLINRCLKGVLREAALERAQGLKKIVLNKVSISDLELIAIGAFSPLTGFMGKADYESVLKDMRLQNGVVWSLPITLPVDKETADSLKIGEEVALTEPG